MVSCIVVVRGVDDRRLCADVLPPSRAVSRCRRPPADPGLSPLRAGCSPFVSRRADERGSVPRSELVRVIFAMMRLSRSASWRCSGGRAGAVEQVSESAQRKIARGPEPGVRGDVEYDLVQMDVQPEQVEVERAEGRDAGSYRHAVAGSGRRTRVRAGAVLSTDRYVVPRSTADRPCRWSGAPSAIRSPSRRLGGAGEDRTRHRERSRGRLRCATWPTPSTRSCRQRAQRLPGSRSSAVPR